MSDLPETSLSLIGRIKNPADNQAWLEFLALYQPIVYRMARKRGMQPADAQDVMQQVFLSVSRAINTWEPGSDRPPFRAWLTTISRNTITKALDRAPKDQGTGSTSMLELLHKTALPQPTSDELVREARKELVRQAADQIRPEFSESTWEAFWLTSIEGRTIPETAKKSGKNPGAIYIARFRVRERLREKIKELLTKWKGLEGENTP